MYFRRKVALRICLVFVLSWCTYIAHGQRLAAQKCLEYQNLSNGWFSPNCSNVVQLIAGGEAIKSGEFPHHALLGYPEEGSRLEHEFKCGGTLISAQHVLTAAHCFTWDNDPTVVRLGEHDTAEEFSWRYDAEIESYRSHPDYIKRLSYNDIALVKLKHAISFTDYIRPACLWQSEKRETTKLIATGFGRAPSQSDELGTVLMKVQLDEFPKNVCERFVKGSRRFIQGLKDGQLCIVTIVDDIDTYLGFGGDPIQVVTNNSTCSYAVVGIQSAGGIRFAIHTKVSHYIGWIEDNVWGANPL